MRRELLKNKLFAIGMIGVGLIPLIVFKDATILLLSVMIGVPLFVSKKNYID